MSDKTQGEQIADSLDQVTDFDNLFEPVPGTDAAPEGDAPAAAAPARGDDGKFTKAPTEPDVTEPAKAAADATAATDDEDVVELTEGEGEAAKTTKLKLSEVLKGYQERQKLQADLQTLAERVGQMPADVETKLVEATKARQQYIAGLEQLQKWMQPQWPSDDLLHTDPAAYASQLAAARQVSAMQRQLEAEHTRVGAENDEVNRTLHESRQRREWSEAVKAWPELKEQATRNEVVSWLQKEGYSPEEVNRITSRDLKIVKRAIAHDKAQAAKETASKVVLAKPRVVRPQARSAPATSRPQQASDALTRLGKSGSTDDAMAALEALL